MKKTRPKLRTILGQPSWSFGSNRVKANLTELGGHLAPVRFKLRSGEVQPFSVSPWAREEVDTVPLLEALRGDFFCCPFGGNATRWRNEQHPPHGESANRKWTLRSLNRLPDATVLIANLKTAVRPGSIEKVIALFDDETVIYQQHILHGMSGPMSVGHHPTLIFPDEPGSGLLSVSRFVRGQVYPGAFESPENRGYQSLKPGATFESISHVPQMNGGYADLSRYPARRGFEDLVMLSADPKLPFAWSTVVFPKLGYLWFSLRDPRVLRSTLFWISNGGRHYSPWNGRHVNVMGIEDTTSHFHDGLAESARSNAVSRKGIPTTLRLNPSQPTTVSHIMGVTDIPRGFDHVADIRKTRGGIELRSRSGKTARCALHLDWLYAPSLLTSDTPDDS